MCFQMRLLVSGWAGTFSDRLEDSSSSSIFTSRVEINLQTVAADYTQAAAAEPPKRLGCLAPVRHSLTALRAAEPLNPRPSGQEASDGGNKLFFLFEHRQMAAVLYQYDVRFRYPIGPRL